MVLYFLYNACSVYLPRLIWTVGIVVKSWWQDETEPNTTLAADLAAKHGRLIVLDINGVLLTSYSELPEGLWAVENEFQPRVVHCAIGLVCLVRPDADKFIQTLKKKTKIIVWSCCRRKKLMLMLDACFPQHARQKYFAGNNALSALEVKLLRFLTSFMAWQIYSHKKTVRPGGRVWRRCRTCPNMCLTSLFF